MDPTITEDFIIAKLYSVNRFHSINQFPQYKKIIKKRILTGFPKRYTRYSVSFTPENLKPYA